MKAFFEEFKNFAMRGNVMDMAVGVVLGAAFGKIVSSLVSNIIMPPLGVLLGGIDFSDFFLCLKSGVHPASLAEAQAQGIPVIAYGLFLNTIIEFLIIAFAIFLVIKQINRLFPKPAAAPVPRLCPFCKQPVAEDATRCPHCTSEIGTQRG
ncbi:MAG: large-conductance mechanosensitive channel protein MscL [Megasphaera sp.]|jgi:large conductance mechanosensitive channel|nr:large-conductance mechanosensitive channel protein MscL [Megasphaera sp.]MCH4188046.1 large-conductance mechanosensitive channel protein MscL [Megasphaera sp.]